MQPRKRKFGENNYSQSQKEIFFFLDRIKNVTTEIEKETRKGSQASKQDLYLMLQNFYNEEFFYQIEKINNLLL